MPRQTCVASLLAIVAISVGTGCKPKDAADIQNPPDTSLGTGGIAVGTTSSTPEGGGGGGRKNKADATIEIYEQDGACYADQPWLSVAAGKTVAWTSETKSSYLVEFFPTPLRDSTGEQFVVTVPANQTSSTYTLSNNVTACSGASTTGCYFQYTIAKVSSSVSKPADFCGPSPMTVGIHIKP